MPDHRKHRGQNPEDLKIFHSKNLPDIREAVKDLSYLLSKQYNINSANKLIGDRYFLTLRQRLAVIRSSCSDQSLAQRQTKEVLNDFCLDKTLVVDGYNILITIESALSGGYIFIGRDGAYRDLSSIHGSYKRVEETLPAISLIGHHLSELKAKRIIWYLDSPISNSGRLKTFLKDVALENQWNWEVEVVNNPDNFLKKSKDVIITSDSMILNEVDSWINLAKCIIEKDIKNVQIVDLRIN